MSIDALRAEQGTLSPALSHLQQGMRYDIDPPVSVIAIPVLKEERHFGWRPCTFDRAVYLGTWDDRIILRGQAANDPAARESICWLHKEELEECVLRISDQNP